MKNRYLFTLLFFGLFINSHAKSVDKLTAKKVAETFLKINNKQQTPSLTLSYKSETTVYFNNNNDSAIKPLYYIFNSNNSDGYIIIAGDDNSIPVLGYSNSSNFDINNIPHNFKKWLEGYKQELNYIINNNINATTQINDEWTALKNGYSINFQKASSVSPLLSTTWSQGQYYNALCPGGSVTGCVATVMAQLMKYWEYPAQGAGFHSYNEDDFGTLSANFGGTTYQWSSMPNNVNSSNNAVATLMFHCGVSVEMDYDPNGSASFGAIDVEPALETYFSYSSSAQVAEKYNYSSSQWLQLLKTELNANRPMYYEGVGNSSGHAFICDGYDNNDLFHFNWGWGGAYDGYFLVNNLNPGGTGTGGGSGSFNSNQKIVKGIQPPQSAQTYNMNLYDNVTLSSTSINYGQAFDVSTNIHNNGSNNFSGDYCAAILDNNNSFIDYVDIKTGWSLQSGYIYSNGITFSTSGLNSMLPGIYYVGIFYRPNGGNWIQVGDGNYSNLVQINVVNPNVMELYSAISVTPGTNITQGESASVNVNVWNKGNSTFFGTFSASLYDLNGNLVQTIESLSETNGLPAGYTYASPYLNFSTQAITANPGTYLLAITHAVNGGNDQFTGSTYFPNPIYITVQAGALQPDVYESNNTENTAYNLSLNFSGNNATVLTTGSNSHIGSDEDYYKINLPSGYDYSITARAHDSYNSGNGQTYTNDVLWSYKTTGSWSTPYDDVMSSNINVLNGGTVKFHVAPYFQGETGSYLFDIQISRTSSTVGNNDNLDQNSFILFPNPTTQHININTNEDIKIDHISIVDISGTQIKFIAISSLSNQTKISVENLANGTYFLFIQSEDRISQHKFIKL